MRGSRAAARALARGGAQAHRRAHARPSRRSGLGSLALTLALAASATAGCASHTPFPAYEAWPQGQAPPSHPVRLRSPEAARVVLRALLERGNEEIDLTLYALLGPAAAIRIVAVSDLGSTAFDVAHTRAGPTVHRDSSDLSRALLATLAWNIEASLRPPFAQASLVRLPDGAPAMASEAGSRRFLGAWGADGRIRKLHTGDASGVLGVVDIAGWGPNPRGAAALPARVSIDLVREGLRARIDVLQWEPTELPPNAFTPEG